MSPPISTSAVLRERTRAASGPPTASPDAGAPLARAKLDVLVVDDDPWTGEALARLVRSFGHACRAASSGGEALRIVSEGHTNVLISDWDMPEMSGLELCKRIRGAAHRGDYTYFIFLTGFDDREHLFAAMEAGADHFQGKPVDLDALEAQLLSAARLIEWHRLLATSPGIPGSAEPREPDTK